MSDTDVGSVLKPEARDALEKLDEEFQKRILPTGLNLGLAGGQGTSIGALIGLTAKQTGVDLPLANWGSGTRRLSALAIAEKHKVASPITLVDEIERGLEPYRQRSLVKKLENSPSQIFLTTHSTIVLASAAEASIWYLDAKGKIGQLDAHKTKNLRKEEPEAFLARFTIVAEGATEVGFVTCFLEKVLAGSPQDHGIYVADGNGNDAVLELLKAMDKAGLAFGGFADDEGNSPTSWQALKTKIGNALFQWPPGCIEQHVFAAIPAANLTKLFEDPDGATGLRLRTMQERLSTADNTLETIVSAAGSNLLNTMVHAASGYVPTGETNKEERKRLKNHAAAWFKSYEGGRELAEKVVQLAAWPTLRPKLMPFLNAVRKVAGLPDIEDLPL
jgi:putative ATP-dependent endonuclease of OLD family